MSALNNKQSNAAQLMVVEAEKLGLNAEIVGSSGSSWYVEVAGYKVRFSDHSPTHHFNFNVQFCERTGWNGYTDVADAIEEVLDEIQDRISED